MQTQTDLRTWNSQTDLRTWNSMFAEYAFTYFRLVGWALTAWCDGTKWLEIRKLHLLPKKFAPGCVITLDVLGNCRVNR